MWVNNVWRVLILREVNPLTEFRLSRSNLFVYENWGAPEEIVPSIFNQFDANSREGFKGTFCACFLLLTSLFFFPLFFLEGDTCVIPICSKRVLKVLLVIELYFSSVVHGVAGLEGSTGILQTDHSSIRKYVAFQVKSIMKMWKKKPTCSKLVV